MSPSSVQQKVSVKKHGMKHCLIVREYGTLIGGALNAARVIAATSSSQ
jgi:hypothetical protein